MFQKALIMSGEDKCQAESAIELAHEIDELSSVARVQIGRGLVSQNKIWAMHNSAGNGDALTFAAGEEIWAVIRTSREADAIESFCDPPPAIGVGEALNEERVLDVFSGGENWDQIESLEDESYLFAPEDRGLGSVKTGCIDPLDKDAAGGRLIDASDEIEERGLSASAGAGDGEEFTAIDGNRERIEGGDCVVVERKAAGDPLDDDERLRCVHRAMSFPELLLSGTR